MESLDPDICPVNPSQRLVGTNTLHRVRTDIGKSLFLLHSVERIQRETHQASARGLRISNMFGEWLSLVEHLVRDQGVGGSNPLSPTNIFNNLQQKNPD